MLFIEKFALNLISNQLHDLVDFVLSKSVDVVEAIDRICDEISEIFWRRISVLMQLKNI